MCDPGVLETTSNFVEHPEVLALRIEKRWHGRRPRRVIASTDCGFGTFTRRMVIEPLCGSAQAIRLRHIASQRLWGKKVA